MARMIDMGVDGIISDNPDLLRKVAGEKGVTLPKGSPVTRRSSGVLANQ